MAGGIQRDENSDLLSPPGEDGSHNVVADEQWEIRERLRSREKLFPSRLHSREISLFKAMELA
jgi:hypothetical protein